MASKGVNKVIIVGNLGKDPEIKYLPSGGAIANVSVATSESWKDKQTGEQKEKTEWHRVVVFGKLAEIVGEYLKKGSQVYFEGKLQTRKWQDQSGQDRYSTEIVVDQMGGVMQMLGGGQQNGQPKQQTQQAPMQQAPQQGGQQPPAQQQPQGLYQPQSGPQSQQQPQPPAQNQGFYQPPANQYPQRANPSDQIKQAVSGQSMDFDDDIPF